MHPTLLEPTPRQLLEWTARPVPPLAALAVVLARVLTAHLEKNRYDPITVTCSEMGGSAIQFVAVLYQLWLPATCLVVTLRRLKRLAVAIMRIKAASPCSS